MLAPGNVRDRTERKGREERASGLLELLGLRRMAVAAACACAGVLAWAAGPALAAGGSDPAFPFSSLVIDAGGSFIQGRPFELFVTGVNEAPEAQSDLVPYDLYLYLLAAKVGTCPTTQQAMLRLVKKHPRDTQIIFKAPVPEVGLGPGLYGMFTTRLFEASAGNFTGSLYICGYSNYAASQDAAWDSFGPITITPAIPASRFPSHRVRLGATSGCWPVASTRKERAQGLSEVRHPARPMVFTFPKAGSHGFTMLAVTAPLNGVWIGRAHTVIGRWHGTPRSTATHKPPGPVTAAVLYPVGWRVPQDGAHLQVGTRCSSRAGL